MPSLVAARFDCPDNQTRGFIMADNTDGGGNNGLYFIVGGLVVGVIAFVYFDGGPPGWSSKTTNITIEAPTPAAPATTTTTQ